MDGVVAADPSLRTNDIRRRAMRRGDLDTAGRGAQMKSAARRHVRLPMERVGYVMHSSAAAAESAEEGE
jgi:hypothetical protein